MQKNSNIFIWNVQFARNTCVVSFSLGMRLIKKNHEQSRRIHHNVSNGYTVLH